MNLDFNGRELKLHDKIVSLEYNTYSTSLKEGYVMGFTPKMIQIKFRDDPKDKIVSRAISNVAKYDWV